jgi:hypothetical protein
MRMETMFERLPGLPLQVASRPQQGLQMATDEAGRPWTRWRLPCTLLRAPADGRTGRALRHPADQAAAKAAASLAAQPAFMAGGAKLASKLLCSKAQASARPSCGKASKVARKLALM